MTATFDLPLRLKGNYYARPRFFATDVSLGVTRTPNKTRVCALTDDFLNGFRDAVIYECGKSYRRVMKQCGRRWGAQFIKRFDTEISAWYQTPLADLPTGVVHTCLTEAFIAHGWGRLKIDLDPIDHGFLVVELRNSMMPSLVVEADRPVDLLMAGMLGAVFAHLSGKDLDAVQTDCPSLGADASRFIVAASAKVKEVEAWLNRAAPHAAVPHADVVKKFRAADEPPAERNGEAHS